MTETLVYHIHDVAPYINWIYFFHSWGFPPKFSGISKVHDCPACKNGWVSNFPEDEREKAAECARLYDDAVKMLNMLDETYRTYAKFGIYDAYSHDDDIVLTDDAGRKVVLPCLRQQTVVHADDPYLCLSDFINPAGDKIGVFGATVDKAMEKLYQKDDYKRMLVQLLCDRLAEATTERMHEDVRKKYWGYSTDESWTPQELLDEPYQGIRPAIGYPSLPDQSFNFLLEEVVRFSSIGIQLTESGAMMPHASVSGLIFAHPAARYFAIGKIDEQQLSDYAQRRGMKPDDIRKYLIANLNR